MNEIALLAEIAVLEKVIADRGYQKPPIMPSQRTPEFLAMRRQVCDSKCFEGIEEHEGLAVCGPCDEKALEMLKPSHANIVRDVLNRFNKSASGLVSKDYCEGYREACEHILGKIEE
jgi:hypothetical protein